MRNELALQGGAPPTTPTATTSGRARTVFKTNTTGPHGRRRTPIGNGPRPVSTGGPGSKLAKKVGVKSVQYIQMGNAPEVDTKEPNDWDLRNAVWKTGKQFATYLLLPMTETKNDPSLLKTLVCLERQQQKNMPDEYSLYKKAINQIRTGILPGQNNSPKELQDNCYQPLT